MAKLTRKILELTVGGAAALAITLGIYACASLDGLSGDVPATVEAGGTGAFAAACVHNTDCASGLCLSVGADDGGTLRSACTKACQQGSDCLAGWSCIPNSGSNGNVCQCNTAREQCDGRDNDCNGVIDEDAAGACNDSNGGTGWTCTNAACKCAATMCPADDDAGTPAGCADLTMDRLHCGRCDVACPEGATCVSSTCRCGTDGGTCATAPGGYPFCSTDLACHQDFPLTTDQVSYIAPTSAGLVYANLLDAIVKRVPLAGGAPVTVYATGEPAITGLAADGARLVIATPSSLVTCVLPACTAPVVLGEQASSGIAVGGTVVYWIDLDGVVKSHAHDGSGATTPLFVGPAGGTTEAFLAVDGTGIYAAYADGSAHRIGLGGGETLLYAAGQPAPTGIAVDNDRIYVSTSAGVLTCSKNAQVCNNKPAVLVAGKVESVTTDGERVYWASDTGVFGCSATNCKPTTLSERGAFALRNLNLDSSVYYADVYGAGRFTK